MKSPWIFPVAVLLLLLRPGEGREESRLRVGVLFWHESSNDERAFLGVRAGFRLAGLDAVFEREDVAEDAERARFAVRRWEAEGFDLVYAMGTSAALRAGEATRTLPVVFTAVTNPMGSQVVKSWDGSGTNLCGNSNWIAAADVLRVFRTTVPDLARLAVVLSRDNRVSIEEVAEARRHFKEDPSQEIRLMEVWVRSPEELPEAVAKVIESGAQAVWIPIDNMVYRNIDRVAEVTVSQKIPLVSSEASTVGTHAIVAVAVDYFALGRNSVVLAEKVLRGGAEPGTLPVGRMHSFRVLVNLAAARRIGFEVPLRLLATADLILDPERGTR